MSLFRSLPILLVCAAVGLGADTVKLRTLSSKEVSGDLVRINEKEIVIRDKDKKEVATPLLEVLDVELGPAVLPAGTKYIDVELTDGSLLHCGQFTLKKREVELKLISGQDVKLPLAQVSYVLNNAQDKNVRDEWKKLLGKQGNHDMVAVKNEGSVNTLEGTLGEADDKGETINFQHGDATVPVKLERIHGMSFFRKTDPARPDSICKVYDTSNNTLMVLKIAQTPTGYTMTTVCGAQIEFPTQLLARLDFSKGKLTYLSDAGKADCDVKMLEKKESSTLDGTDHVKLDKNLDGGPLRIAGQTYTKGLAVPATTELVYDIGGEYKEFKAILGFDDQVTGDSHVKIVIEGDNRELFKTEMRRGEKEKKSLPIVVDVKNVKQLRIWVKSADLLDLGYHINFADAKVSK
jgi:hypothetical protein